MERNPPEDRGTRKNRPTPQNVEEILRDGSAIDRAIVAAHRRVILRHRQLRVPLAIWRGGEVVEIPPDSVDLPPDPDRVHERTDER